MSSALQQHLPMVRRVARGVLRRVPRSVQLDDLVSAGAEGLVEAERRFDPSRGVPFEAYAELRVRGAVLDELRRHDFVPHTLRRRQRALENARAQAARAGVSTTDEAVCKRLGVDAAALPRWLYEGAMRRAPEELAMELEDGAPRADESLFARERLVPLKSAVAALPERLQLVLSLYYVEEITLKEIGQVLGVTESRVCQLHTEAVKRLRAALEASEDGGELDSRLAA